MPSTFSWLDYSEQQRRRTLEIIAALNQQVTRDELGLGGVRDAFAALLFPGIGTVQSRARYYLFIPWLYRLVGRTSSVRPVAQRLREHEIRLIDTLLQNGESDGVIGRRSRSRLKRLPSNIYWFGLGEWGIRRYDGSQESFHDLLDRSRGRTVRAPAESEDGAWETPPPLWDGTLPEPPGDFPERATFVLDVSEACYLRDRIRFGHPRSMLAAMVSDNVVPTMAAFPWEYPRLDALSPELREQLHHARIFSAVMHGAALLYNRMLAEAYGNDELLSGYRDDLASWTEAVARVDGFVAWEPAQLWALLTRYRHTIHPAAQRFVGAWTAVARRALDGADPDNAASQELIKHREIELKRCNARLVNQRALELWQGAAGIRPMDYSWPTAKTIAADIVRGIYQLHEAMTPEAADAGT